MKSVTVTPNTSMIKIQEYFKGGYIVTFAEGVYNIIKTLFIYSNTNIILSKGAVLVRKNSSHIFRGYINPKINYSYNAVENVVISGEGTLKGNGTSITGSVIGFMHGNNITIKDIKITNVVKSHGIDLPACSNVTIDNVKFNGRIIDKTATFREEIQIDEAVSVGYPYWNKTSACYNYNICKNIIIKNCTFEDANHCIGMHTDINSKKKHENIQVIDCTAKGLTVDDDGTFVKIINANGVIIKGNKIKGFNRGIEINTTGYFYNSNGVKYNNVPVGKTGCENVTIEDNTISNASGTAKAAGIFISSQFDNLLHKDISIKKNKFRLANMSAKYDIYVDFANNVTEENNDIQLDVKIK